MLIKAYGAAVYGIDAIIVTIEVSVEIGVGFNLVGLPDAAVKESYQRVMSALKREFGISETRKKMNRQLEKVADSFGSIIDI